MRIGFLSSTSMVLERYWNKLYDKADCWWGVTQPQLLHDLLKKKNITKIVYHYDKYIINPDINLAISIFLLTLDKAKIYLRK